MMSYYLSILLVAGMSVDDTLPSSEFVYAKFNNSVETSTNAVNHTHQDNPTAAYVMGKIHVEETNGKIKELSYTLILPRSIGSCTKIPVRIYDHSVNAWGVNALSSSQDYANLGIATIYLQTQESNNQYSRQDKFSESSKNNPEVFSQLSQSHSEDLVYLVKALEENLAFTNWEEIIYSKNKLQLDTNNLFYDGIEYANIVSYPFIEAMSMTNKVKIFSNNDTALKEKMSLETHRNYKVIYPIKDITELESALSSIQIKTCK